MEERREAGEARRRCGRAICRVISRELIDPVVSGARQLGADVEHAAMDIDERIHHTEHRVVGAGKRAGVELKRVAKVMTRAAPFFVHNVVDADFRARFLELVGKGLARVLQALAAPVLGNPASKEMLVGSALARWMVDAGGEFPKLAQVLAVQPDLVRNAEVRQQLHRVLENCKTVSMEEMKHAIRRSSPQVLEVFTLGPPLNAGSIAQVNSLGEDMVVKVARESTLQKMRVDFHLFKQSREVLQALELDQADAKAVEKILHLVVLSEQHTYEEFNLLRECEMMERARSILGESWQRSWANWMATLDLTQYPSLNLLREGPLMAQLRQYQGPQVKSPEVLEELCSERVLVMQRVGGQSLAQMIEAAAAVEATPSEAPLPNTFLAGSSNTALQLQVVGVLLGVVVPLQGYMLLVTSDTHGAHADPHPGNFRYEEASQTLWLLDWGGFINIALEDRLNMCRLILAVDDYTRLESAEIRREINDRMRDLGFEGRDLTGVALALFSHVHLPEATAVPEDPFACLHGVDVVPTGMIPLVRAVGLVRGMLTKLEARLNLHRHHLAGGELRLSLAHMWRPFAEQGLLGRPR